MWLLQPWVKYIWVHLKPIRLKAHLGLVEAECWLQAREPGHTPRKSWPPPIPHLSAYPQLFMWFLSNCIIWNEATGRLCPSAPTLLIEKSKYLAEVNRAEMRSLTFLQERSHNTSIRRMSDRAGRATLFHKFFFYSHFSALSSLSSSIDQIMTSKTFRMQGKGLWAWDEAILSGPSGSVFRNIISWKGPPKAYPNSLLVLVSNCGKGIVNLKVWTLVSDSRHR